MKTTIRGKNGALDVLEDSDRTSPTKIAELVSPTGTNGDENMRQNNGSDEVSRYPLALSPTSPTIVRVGKARPTKPRNGTLGGTTRRRLTKKAQRESDAWFRVLFEHLPETVLLLDPHDAEVIEPVIECNAATWQQDGVTHRFMWSLEWPIVECNQAACRRHGYLHDELIGQPAGIIGPLASQPGLLVGLLEELESVKTVRFQALHRCKDGTCLPVEVCSSLIILDGQERVVMSSRELANWKHSETETQKLADLSRWCPNPLLELDANGQTTYYNPAAENLARLLGKETPAALLPPEMSTLAKECLASGESKLGVGARISERTISWSLCPVADGRSVFASAVDITSWPDSGRQPLRLEIPKEIPSPRNQLNGGWADHELVQAAADAIVSLDTAEIFRSFNCAAEQLTGYRAGEVVGQRFNSIPFLASSSLSQWKETLHRIIAGNETKAVELELLRKDKRCVTVEANGRAIHREGKPAGVHLILRDVTERRQIEQTLRKREASLMLAQKIGHMGSWELDVGTGRLDWSEETFRIFNLRPGDFIPTGESFYGLVHPTARDAVRQVHEQAVKKGEPYSVEYRILRRDASECSEYMVVEQAEIIMDEAGKAARMIGTIQDITCRKQQEEQSRTVEKWESIGRLAGGVAHDFNSILTEIRRCTEVIQASPKLNDELAPHLKQLATAAERATNLTWQLLAASRKQAAPDLVDLNKLINQVAEMLQHALEPDIDLELVLASALPAIPAHSNMLEQVLLNLAISSHYAMTKGGRLVIETKLSEMSRADLQQQPDAKPGKYLCLRVADTGGGVNPARMGCIHEPFFTTRNMGQETGLGLATVHGIVKQHQGWIDVSSVLGQGTAFRVYLPVHPGKMDSLAAERLHRPICGGSETILLVEGEPLLRALARSILQRYGYQVLEAGSGTEALGVWEKHTGQIILLLADMAMPGGINSQELAQQLRVNNPKLKTLYTSGYSAGLTQSNGQLKPGLNFLPKPYSATALAQAVRNCLDRTGGSPAPDQRRPGEAGNLQLSKRS